MGLGGKARERKLARLLNLYQLSLIFLTVIFSIYGLIKNLIFTQDITSAVVSGIPVIGLVIAYFVHNDFKATHKTSVLRMMFVTINLILAFHTIVLQLLWGIVIPYLPLLYAITNIHLLLTYKLKLVRIYNFLYILILSLQLFNIFPLIKLPYWYEINSATKLITTTTALILSSLIFYISKISPLLGLWYLVVPRSAHLLADILIDGLRYRLIQHRLNNISQILLTHQNTKQISQTITLLTHLLTDRKSTDNPGYFIKRMKLLNSLYHPKKVTYNPQKINQLLPKIPPAALPIIIDVTHNAIKHSTGDVSIDISEADTIVVVTVSNKVQSQRTGDSPKLKDYSGFSELPLLMRLTDLGDLFVNRIPDRITVTLKLNKLN